MTFRQNSKLDLYFDMDGTIYNISELAIQIYNKEFAEELDYTKHDQFSLKNYTKVAKLYFENLLQRQGMFLDGKPVDYMVGTVKKLKQEGYNIYFLTSPEHTPYCYFEKCEWLKKHFPWVDLKKQLIATGNKRLLAKSNRLLIDDNINFLKEWNEEGGISIGFGNTITTKNYKGFHVNDANKLYQLIKQMDGEHVSECQQATYIPCSDDTNGCVPKDCSSCELREEPCRLCGCYERFADMVDGLCDECQCD